MPIGCEGASSPVIFRRDTTQFTIPQSYQGSPPARLRGHTEVHCQSLPGCFVKSKSLETLNTIICQKSIGQVCMEIWYSQEDELLVVRLQRVDLLAKPSPSVICSDWKFEPEVKIGLFNKKHNFWDTLHSKEPRKIAPRSATYITMKKGCVQDQCLVLTCYDAIRQNDLSPIGYVFVALKDMDLSWKSSSYVREIVPSSEPGGFSTGRIELKCRWISSAEKVNLKIGSVSRLKSPHGTLKRSFFVKVFAFSGGSEVKRWKSQSRIAKPDLDFDNDAGVNLAIGQINDSSFVIQLFAKPREKFLFHSELIGATIIGPYMPKVLNSFTQWESMIAKPFEEIVDIQDLYL